MILFVSGTDTAVGKTVLSAALCRQALEQGRDVAYFKPVQTGLLEGDYGDRDYVEEASGVPAFEGERYAQPLAPSVAAQLEGRMVDVEALLKQAKDLVSTRDLLIVEGAGGLLVPFTQGVDMADFAGRLNARVLLAVRPSLGTLNHSALSIEALRHRNLPLESLVLCGWPEEPGTTERTNREALAAMAPLVGYLPYLPDLDTEHPGQPTPPELLEFKD